MDVRVNRTVLAGALGAVLRVAPWKPLLPVLGCVHVRALGNALELTATDLEASIRVRVPAEVSAEGEVLVPARTFGDLVRRVPEEAVRLQRDGNQTVLSYGDSRVAFSWVAPEDFPSALFSAAEPCFRVSEKELRKALGQVIFAAAGQDDQRQILQGVQVEGSEGAVELVATDTFRLAWRRLPVEGSLSRGILLPAAALRELAKMLGDGDSLVTVAVGGSAAAFHHDSFVLSVREMGGRLPIEWRNTIPNSWRTRIRVVVRPLVDALERASVVVGKPPVVRLRIEGESLWVEAVSDAGRLEERVAVLSEGEPLEVALNPFFMLEALRALSCEEAAIEFTGPLSAITFRPAERTSDCFSLLLPIRLL